MSSLEDLSESIRSFASSREWEQFQTPRNLVLALTGEVGELAAEFQWTPDGEVSQLMADELKRSAIEGEVADVAIYLIRLADVLEIDLASAIGRKLEVNRVRYPEELSRGSTAKYTEIEDHG
jgi:dCTP diphosphatase